ncbi:hypothetical protein D8674_011417 [Pyrus ussuriensis x Pyrus communis]|uniref:Uncharacterized protein n=1 Tax=Pyrus ussuriensis x Pyrus communis TaxID=2448454 RepID=A0A5N5FYM3_9ROSA|nr:hypothetical protein D8674_011417 [Pyrus ussuriensis x Pyrus communis]
MSLVFLSFIYFVDLYLSYMSDIDYEVVASKIQASDCYEVMNFRTIKIRGQYKVMPHDTQLIFTTKTVFIKLSAVFPPIPRHRFFLLDFNMLYPHLNKDDILIDVIGHLTAVQHLEPKQINQRIAQKCDTCIENIRKEELSVTLWGDVFSSLSVHSMSLLIIIVFTSLKVKLLSITSSSLFFIDLNIPEVNSYKSAQVNKAEVLRTARRSNVLTHDIISGMMLALIVSNKCKKIQQLDNSFVRNTPTRYQHARNV